jgi:predicted DNA-binding transcriptional regulator AlpA
MTEFDFMLVVEGQIDDEQVLDLLYEAGCDDAVFGSVDGVGFGEFVREGGSFDGAVISAIRQVESVPGLRVLRIEPDDLLSLSEIAERLGRSRESVRLLSAGLRGPGDFPAPVSHLRDRFRLWRWSDVAAWAGQVSLEERQRARFVAVLNAALEMRRTKDLPKAQRTIVRAVAAG